MDTMDFSEAKDQLLELIKAATNQRRQVRITSDEGNVVVLPEETYENILITLEFLSTPGLFDNFSQPQFAEEDEAFEPLHQASSQ